jgi:hypothetical protein
MEATQSKSTSATFEKVVLHYKQYLAGREYKKVNNIWRILKILPAEMEHFSFFMIRDGVKGNKNNLFIEFHVENKKSGSTPIHTVIKQREYWANIKIFDKEIKHYPKKWDEGHIFIKCSYSDSVEKICAYINEFIYQVKSRIESIIGSSK